MQTLVVVHGVVKLTEEARVEQQRWREGIDALLLRHLVLPHFLRILSFGHDARLPRVHIKGSHQLASLAIEKQSLAAQTLVEVDTVER